MNFPNPVMRALSSPNSPKAATVKKSLPKVKLPKINMPKVGENISHAAHDVADKVKAMPPAAKVLAGLLGLGVTAAGAKAGMGKLNKPAEQNIQVQQ